MPIYWDKDAERFNYLMVLPSGARIEFRQPGGASDTFETADSSYTQLKTTGAANPNEPVENITITVTTTDGTKMKYEWKAGAFRCSNIKDRNGNYITVNTDEQGLLRTVTDTLGRIITVNYDAELSPTSITQTWKNDNGAGSNVTQTCATFAYTTTTIDTNFDSSLTVVGPADNTVLKVLQKITYPNGGFTQFDYNGYGQVWKIRNVAADSSSHILNYVRTNLESPSSNQTDCPRFTETRSWVENFNQDQSGAPQETVIINSISENQSYNLPDGHNGTATKIEVSMANHPQGAVSKTFVGSSGWQEGLTIASEDWANATSGLERKRRTWTNWTQDDENLSYILNPRVTESKVGDTTNIKRSTTEYRLIPYTNIAEYGLVNAVYVYDSDQTTILKKVETDYNLSSSYISRRIIGLPSEVRAYGRENGSLNLVFKVGYQYDEGDFSDSSLEQNLSTVIQHDNPNFGASFITGRGNLTSVTRHDVTGQTSSVTSSVKYNTAGAPVAQISPWTSTSSRIVKISYADSFNDNQNRNTFAYPTKIYDPANNYSEVKYRFDIGANVWAKSPAPAGNTTGKETNKLYDAIGRLSKETVLNTGAYTRYEYPTNQIQSKAYSTIVDTNNNGVGDTADEVLSESWTDGIGRVRKSRIEHPNSSGGWSGSLVEYDILGQVKRSTVPTEMDSNWNPAGDDYRLDGNGNVTFLWNYQKYDWKGRVIRTINTDGVDSPVLNDSDQLINYEGCGCAGGQITTVQSQSVPRDDQPNTNARRVQRIYQDILGRAYKTEEMSWDGTTPYKTTVLTFNGRDQVTQIREYAGAEGSSTFQDSTVIYDGLGRTWKTHAPEQRNADNTPAYTTTTYNLDNSVQSVIDARGASDNYTYNNLGLVTQVDYSVPQGSTIPVTPTTNFSYDALGNRTQMTDASGTTTYQYNELSQITSETKQFTGLTTTFTLGYEYQLNGEVKKLDIFPNNTSVSYNYDKIGRVNSVTGQGFLSGAYAITNIASNINYRAWNNVKSINYGSSFNLNINYDNNLKVSSFQIPTVMEINYQYNADGRVKFADNLLDGTFDRSYSYDHMERLKTAKSGAGANGGNNVSDPYDETFGFDAFNNGTSRNTNHWSQGYSFQATYTNNRRNGWQYDTSGNVTKFDDISNVFDASETKTKTIYDVYNAGSPQSNYYRTLSEKFLTYDGDGQVILDFDQTNETQKIGSMVRLELSRENKQYNLKSTVLGGAVVYIYRTGSIWYRSGSSSSWSDTETNIFLHGKILATQNWHSWGGNQNFGWSHIDPMATMVAGTSTDGSSSFHSLKAVLDLLGQISDLKTRILTLTRRRRFTGNLAVRKPSRWWKLMVF